MYIVILFVLGVVASSEGLDDNIVNSSLAVFYNDVSSFKIVGGKDTTIERHPYQVYLNLSGSSCGGFIISPNWVMTAAHCIEEASTNTSFVLAGTAKRDSGGTWFNVSQIISHELYDKSTIDYDYGLIKIVGSFSYGKTINQVALPAQDAKIPIIGLIEVTGWGIEKTGGTQPITLKSVLIAIYWDTWCKMYYPGGITSRMFCGGIYIIEGKGSCQGDSGGPAVYKNVAIGIVSFGGKCESTPSVFAKVSYIINWMKSKTGIP